MKSGYDLIDSPSDLMEDGLSEYNAPYYVLRP